MGKSKKNTIYEAISISKNLANVMKLSGCVIDFNNDDDELIPKNIDYVLENDIPQFTLKNIEPKEFKIDSKKYIIDNCIKASVLSAINDDVFSFFYGDISRKMKLSTIAFRKVEDSLDIFINMIAFEKDIGKEISKLLEGLISHIIEKYSDDDNDDNIPTIIVNFFYDNNPKAEDMAKINKLAGNKIIIRQIHIELLISMFPYQPMITKIRKFSKHDMNKLEINHSQLPITRSNDMAMIIYGLYDGYTESYCDPCNSDVFAPIRISKIV